MAYLADYINYEQVKLHKKTSPVAKGAVFMVIRNFLPWIIGQEKGPVMQGMSDFCTCVFLFGCEITCNEVSPYGFHLYLC